MKRKIQFFVVALLASMLTLSSCGPTNDPSNPSQSGTSQNVNILGVDVTSENNVRNIKVDQTLQLTAVVYPAEASQNVVWSSSDETVATVTNGLVTGVKVGTVNIRATSLADNNFFKDFALVVEAKPAEVINPETITITSRDNQTTVPLNKTLTLSAVVGPEGASQSVNWSSSDEAIATVSRGVVHPVALGEVTITATAKDNENVSASFNVTVVEAEIGENDKSFEDMAFSTHDTYVSCDDKTQLKIKGTVTHMSPIGSDGTVNFYIQNGTEGYYFYKHDNTSYPIEEGKSYVLGGFKKYYNGLNEIIDVAYYEALTETIPFSYNSLEGITNPMDAKNLLYLQASYVEGSAVLKSVTTATKAYNFYAIVNNVETTLRVDPAQMTAEEFETISNTLSRYAEGTSFTFKAMLSAFGYSTVSNQYMIVKSKDLGFGEMSDQDIVDAVAGMIEIPTSIQQNVDTIDLPTSMAGFNGVTITWSSNNDAINAQTGAVTHSANNVNVTLTATVKKGTATKTVTFEVEVLKLDNATYEVLVSFDCEDALPGDQNGNSSSKASYNEGTVELGEPKATWRLKNALISHIENDRVVGAFGIRVKCNTDETKTGAVSIEKDGEYNVVELDAAVYGKDVTTIKIRIDYSTDGGNTWVKGNSEQGLDTTITTYRFYLPEGNKRISIVAVAGSGNRCNLDNIKLMK